MANVSENFRLHELVCPCCGQANFSPRLVDALEALRTSLGDSPVHVNSCVRCVAWNKSVGGLRCSKHLSGEAADIVVRGKDPVEVAMAAEDITAIRNGGIGIYDNFVHIDVALDKDRPARWQG